MSNWFFYFLKKPNEKYVEEAGEKGPNAEQRKWEEEHLNAALLKFGAKDAKTKKKVKNCVLLMHLPYVNLEQNCIARYVCIMYQRCEH